MTPPVSAAVFASGSGTNLRALLDNETPDGPYRIVVVISDRKGAGALERAEAIKGRRDTPTLGNHRTPNKLDNRLRFRRHQPISRRTPMRPRNRRSSD